MAAFATGANAHVAIFPFEGKPATNARVDIRIHGCEGGITTAVKVDLPRRLVKAHPVAVDGWTMASHTSAGKLASVTWTAYGAPEPTPEFSVHVELPLKEGALYFPVTLTCGGQTVRWTQRPHGGKPLDHPAPVFTVAYHLKTPPMLHLH